MYCVCILLFSQTVSMIMSIKTACSDDTDGQCETDHKYNWDVVPYVDHFPLPQFSKKINDVFIGDYKFVIHQSWQSVGVAGVVWDCSITLSEYLYNNSHFVAKKAVLELGAGTGLPSIVAAKLGAKVIATDIPKALELLKENVNENLSPLEKSHVKIESLTWGQPTDPNLNRLYDMIIGADLVYDETLFDDLIYTLITYANVATDIYIAARIRYEKDEKFFAKLKHYFLVDEIFYDQSRDIRLFLCHKKTL